jgi:enterochelin esterase-like enzyme
MQPFRTLEVSDPRFSHDGLRHFTVKSRALGHRADATFWAPEALPEPSPLVILLHGVYGSHWAWALKGGAHRTTRALIASGEIPPMILAMPSDGLWGDGSGYAAHHGADYERWIIEEVPAAIRCILGDESLAPKFFLCGLSMGGYGAMRLGARHADRCAGISAHSAIVEPGQLGDFIEEDASFIPSGETALAAILTAGAALPPLRFDCGLADALLPANRALHEALDRAGLPHRYQEFSGGHEWSYWEARLADSLRYFAAVWRG